MVQAGAGSGLGAGREAGGWVITAHENMGGARSIACWERRRERGGEDGVGSNEGCPRSWRGLWTTVEAFPWHEMRVGWRHL